MSKHFTRRDFVGDAAKLALGAMILPRRVLGGVGFQPPSATLNIAVVGAGGMGMSNMSQLVSENLVAVCDVDFPFVERQLAGRLRTRNNEPPSPENVKLRDAYMKATRYADFREMLEKQRDIEAVVIATPDHVHAAIAIMAMKMGKHVYVQKPMAYSVYESRLMARVAKETGVVTQMGNQGHSMEGTRRIVELINSGIIGRVREVHIWTDRPFRYWAQGIPRPGQDVAQAAAARAAAAANPTPPAAPAPVPVGPPPPPRWNIRTVENAILKAMAENPQTPPPGLDWNLFLGPAPEVPYHPVYHPFSWRGWVDFGVSAVGDMGAHLIDQAYWALGLTQPTAVTASSTPWGGPANKPASYPMGMSAQYEFPATASRPSVNLFWYDGGLMPPRPPFMPDNEPLSRADGGGGVFIGEKGSLSYEVYGNNPKIYPESLAKEAESIPKTVARIPVSHEMNWVQACRGEAQPSAPFEYSAALNETMLLPIVALRAGQGRKILYDSATMTVTNVPEANQYLTREYRKGWEL